MKPILDSGRIDIFILYFSNIPRFSYFCGKISLAVCVELSLHFAGVPSRVRGAAVYWQIEWGGALSAVEAWRSADGKVWCVK